MSKKNIFLLAAGYIAGGLIASLYNTKKSEELKSDIEKSKVEGEGEFKVLLNNFIETHQNLINDIKNHVNTEKNRELFYTKKEELLKIIDSYKIQGLELLEELKVKGKSFILEASEKLEVLYNEKRLEIDSLKDIAPEKLSEIKEKLRITFEEIKNKMKQ
ncbi:MAG: hypothetical protein Q8K30_06570 [Candidatus Gracilibacteria bacterium]|nr:hypothetical protein [Candidatus Gracilibacteria bacterium]